MDSVLCHFGLNGRREGEARSQVEQGPANRLRVRTRNVQVFLVTVDERAARIPDVDRDRIAPTVERRVSRRLGPELDHALAVEAVKDHGAQAPFRYVGP